jgi:hypothetical protein
MINEIPLDIKVLILIKLLNGDHEHAGLVFVLAVLEEGVYVDFGVGLVAMGEV